MQERVAIFIDGSNLYHALKENVGRTDLNFSEFARRLVGQRQLSRTYYYNILQDRSQNPEGFREQQEFLDVLRNTPYLEVRLGGTKLSQGVPVEKGVDIMLATDLLHFAANNLYDTAVLVSGDGDFAYALQTAKNLGKHIEVAHFEKNVSRDLLEVADLKHLMNRDFFKELWVGKPRSRHRRPGGPKRFMPEQKPQQPREVHQPSVPPPAQQTLI
ncbi:MAG: NYN domain-containing protein [Dehalococcoidia bacterium]|nr:NYN domain-containing protein [Dehalococcoidia bacterium]